MNNRSLFIVTGIAVVLVVLAIMTQPSGDSPSGQSTLWKQPQGQFDASRFVVTQVFFESKDGTRVPMFIAHKKGIKLDHSNPTLLRAPGR